MNLRKKKKHARIYKDIDNFNYTDALKEASKQDDSIEKYLKNICETRDILKGDKEGEVDYSIAIELIENAKRRMKLELYDDAVSRLYRATELIAQIFLYKHFEIRTNKVKESDIPKSLLDSNFKDEFTSSSDQSIKIGLGRAYQLIKEKTSEVVTEDFYNEKKNIKYMNFRNLSYLAHGFEPTTQKMAKKMLEFVENTILARFLKYEGIEAQKINFPKTQEEL